MTCRFPRPGRVSSTLSGAALAAVLVSQALPAKPAAGAEPVTATVTKSDGTTVEIDRGSRDGVRTGMRFRVFTLGKVVRIPLTGTVTYSEGQPVATVRVVDASDSSSRCMVEFLQQGSRIVAGLDAVGIPDLAAASGAIPAASGAPLGSSASAAPLAPAPAPSPFGKASLPTPTGLGISASPLRPVPGQKVKLTVLGLENAGAGYLVRWSSSRGGFSAEETPTPTVTWIAPRIAGRHEVRASVALASGVLLDGRGIIQVAGDVAVRGKLELERVMGYSAFENGKPLNPEDVAFDEHGNAYFLDTKLRCIYRVERGAEIKPFASRQTCADAGLRAPVAMAVRGGKVFVLDSGDPYVKVFSEGDRFERAMTDRRKMSQPVDIAADPRGLAFVLDRARRCFHIFDANGSYLHERGVRGRKDLGEFEQPVAIDVGPGGNIFVLDAARNDIQVFSPTYSVFSKIGLKTRRGNGPVDLAVASDGKSVFVLEGPQGLVARYGVDGKVISYPEKDQAKFPDLPAKAARLTSDGLGRLYVLPRSRGGIFRYTYDGLAAGRFAADPPGKALGLAVDDAGRFAVLDQESPHIRLYDPDGWTIARFGQTTDVPAPYRLPRRIAMSRRGKLVVTLGQRSASAFDVPADMHAVHVFNSRGSRARSFGERGNRQGQFKAPEDLDTDRAGNIYVLDRDLFRISVFSERGSGVTPEGERPLSRGSRLPHEVLVPSRIAVDQDTGDVYVYDMKTRLIKKYSQGGVYIGTTEADLGLKDVSRMRVDHLGFLWVFDRKRQELKRVDFRANMPKESLALPLRDLVGPGAVDFGLDGGGRVYVLTAKDLVYVFR